MRLRAAAAATVFAVGLGSVLVLAGAASADSAPVAPPALCPQLPAAPAPAAAVPTTAAGGHIAPPQLGPSTPVGQPPAAAASPAAVAGPTGATATSALPYPLPAAHGLTGREEPVDNQGRVPSTGQKVTFSQFAVMGAAYRDYYITMRWDWAAYSWDGHLSSIDQAQYSWMAAKPRLVLVTNPRTGKSIITDAMEAGPGPWVTADTHTPPAYWTTPVRGTPSSFTGIVSGFPPVALAALGATTGYAGEHGDDLTYQWAPDQNAVPGPTAARASAADVSAPAPCTPTKAVTAGYTAPDGVTVPIPASKYSQYAGIDWSKYTITAPNTQVAKGIAAGLGYLGTPYVWGGGGAHGPDNGCGRGGGQSNSCQGTIGFDCSGLTAYVLGVAGQDIPGDSSSQRAAGQAIPWNQALPGDIIGYPGHVAIYLGVVNGQRLQLEAPDVGQNVRVTTIFRSDGDSVVHRYWGAAHL